MEPIEHHEHHHSQSPDIHGRVCETDIALQHLGGHIFECASISLLLEMVQTEASNTEIHYLYHFLLTVSKEHIFQLQISVYDPLGVASSQTTHDLVDVRLHLHFAQSFPFLHVLLQLSSLTIVHNQHYLLSLLKDEVLLKFYNVLGVEHSQSFGLAINLEYPVCFRQLS